MPESLAHRLVDDATLRARALAAPAETVEELGAAADVLIRAGRLLAVLTDDDGVRREARAALFAMLGAVRTGDTV